MALVGSSASDVHLVKVGGALPGGSTLAEVHRDRILINTGAGFESVLLPRQAAPAPAQPPAVPTAATAPQSLGSLLQQAPDIIPGIIRPQVVVEGGKQLGFRAYPGPNRQAFDKLGLRAGDLVTAINGTPLSDPAVGRELFANLGAAAVARVTVARDGRTLDLNLNLAQVQADLKAATTSPAGNDP
jgi:general secretion pathway protein C